MQFHCHTHVSCNRIAGTLPAAQTACACSAASEPYRIKKRQRCPRHFTELKSVEDASSSVPVETLQNLKASKMPTHPYRVEINKRPSWKLRYQSQRKDINTHVTTILYGQYLTWDGCPGPSPMLPPLPPLSMLHSRFWFLFCLLGSSRPNNIDSRGRGDGREWLSQVKYWP